MKICKQCKKPFKGARKSQKFCSPACSRAVCGKGHPNWKGAKFALVCEQCGETFETYASQNTKFCSVACRTNRWKGKKHPRWNRVTKACKYCGGTFDVPQFRKESAIFCSVECTRCWQMENNKGKVHPLWKKVEMTCETCGETFEIIPCRIETGRHFCSAACMGKWRSEFCVGEKSSRWQGGISFEPYPATFNAPFKRAIRSRDNQKCTICKLSGRCVHHIDYDKQGTVPENCITLCRKCHAVTNANRDYWQSTLAGLMERRQEHFDGLSHLRM